MLLSLFCGAGGLDLGFENAGYDVGLAFDIREPSVRSYNNNRRQRDIKFELYIYIYINIGSISSERLFY